MNGKPRLDLTTDQLRSRSVRKLAETARTMWRDWAYVKGPPSFRSRTHRSPLRSGR